MTADTNSALEILSDMKNLRIENLSAGVKEIWILKHRNAKWPEKVTKPDDEVDKFDPTENGKASEKAHGASNQTQLGFHCHLNKSPNLASCCDKQC